MKIPLTKPVIDDCEREYILKPLQTGWLVQGPFVEEFENLFSEFTGSRFARAAANCTAALHLALVSLAIGERDRVVIPSFTYIASANAVEYSRAGAVFCDIDLRTFNLDLESLKEALRRDRAKRIKAIMPVNLFGLCADLPEIMKLAKEYNLKVIEDSACGLGSYINGRHSGTFGDIGCFSFHPRKAVTTGEGGMLVTDRRDIAEKVVSLRDHGAGKSDLMRHNGRCGFLLPEFDILGFNYRMSDLHGALGVCQMRKAGEILKRRRAIAHRYNAALKDAGPLSVPSAPLGYTHSYQSYVCTFMGGKKAPDITFKEINKLSAQRDRFMRELEKRGITTRQGTHAVHTLGYYRRKYNLRPGDFLNSYAADRLSVALPLYAQMTDEEFGYIITNIKEALS